MLSREQFAIEFAGLCEVFERTPTDGLINAYYNSLCDLTDKQFVEAIASVLRTRKYTKLPLPHEIREGIMEDAQSSAIIALDKAEKAIERHGSYTSVIFDDPVIHMVVRSMGGWPRFCCPAAYGDDQEWQWKQKEFIRLYDTFSKRPVAECPPVLSGIADIENSSAGRLEWLSKPKIVGDERKALAWTSTIKALPESGNAVVQVHSFIEQIIDRKVIASNDTDK